MSNRIKATYYEYAEPHLLSGARYKTKLTPKDLPPWYIEGVYYGYKRGYMRASNVSGLSYKPNLFTNHLFKDDFLLIQYSDVSEDKAKDILNCKYPCHEYVWGWNIVTFLMTARRFSGYDTAEIKQQIIAKADWLRAAYPDDAFHILGDRNMAEILDELEDTM